MTDQSTRWTPIVTGYGHFVLRLRLSPPTDPPTFTGLIERLGTDEQRRFENADDLIRLLGARSGDLPKTETAAALLAPRHDQEM